MKREATEVRDAAARYAPQGDVAVVPEGYVELGAITQWLSGGTPSRSVERYWQGHIPWISASTLRKIEIIDSDQCVTSEAVAAGSKMTPINSTLLLVRGSALHNEIRAGIVCKPVCFNQDVKALIPSKQLYPRYLTYSILGREDELLKLVSSAGNTAGVLDTKLVQSFRIWLPALDEQRAIATALSDVDALLEALDRLIAKKRDIKQATMQQLLTGQTRLPGFEGEWESVRLGDHVTFLKNGVNSRVELLDDGSVRYLHYGDIHATGASILKPSSLPFLPSAKAKTLSRLQDGDLIIADASEDMEGVGKSVELTGVGQTELVAGLHTIAARFEKSILADGFKAYLQFCPEFISALRRLAAGTKVYAITRPHIAGIEMRLPEVEEQREIANVFLTMDVELEALQQRRAKTVALKQAMMQELLTGRIRLIKPNKSSDVQPAYTAAQSVGHNWAFNEAVVISVLIKHFGKEHYPVGRKRYTKLSYLLHRHVERKTEGYLKKAAGPYNPQTRYGGPEKIAKQNRYIKQHKGPKGHSGFIAADDIAQAEGYFEKWYGADTLKWLEQFRFSRNDGLEVLTTVDMAVEELRSSGRDVDVASVKDVIGRHPEWKAKLERSVFSDSNIAKAIKQCEALFGVGVFGGEHA